MHALPAAVAGHSLDDALGDLTEKVNEDEERAARAQPAVDEAHLAGVLDILRPALGVEVLERLVGPLTPVLGAHPEASGHDHLQAANRMAAQVQLVTVRSPVGYLSKVLDEQVRQRRGARPPGVGLTSARPARAVSDTVARGDALLREMSDRAAALDVYARED